MQTFMLLLVNSFAPCVVLYRCLMYNSIELIPLSQFYFHFVTQQMWKRGRILMHCSLKLVKASTSRKYVIFLIICIYQHVLAESCVKEMFG